MSLLPRVKQGKSPGPQGKARQGLGSLRAGIQLHQENIALRRKLRQTPSPVQSADVTKGRRNLEFNKYVMSRLTAEILALG